MHGFLLFPSLKALRLASAKVKSSSWTKRRNPFFRGSARRWGMRPSIGEREKEEKPRAGI